MKIARNWIILIVVLLGIAAALFISGKQHRVFIDNKKVGEYTAIDVSYSINGEKAKKIRVNKKAMVYVKMLYWKMNLNLHQLKMQLFLFLY